MKGDTRRLVCWALGRNFLTHNESDLYYQYLELSGKRESKDSRSRFLEIMGRLLKTGLAVRIFDRCWAFPDADIFVRLREHPEAAAVVLQDALESRARVGHVGGFDVLYKEACVNVPPKRKIIFATGDGFLDIKVDLRRMGGANIRLDALVVPDEGAGMGFEGVVKTKIEGFPYRCSDVDRAVREARWLADSEWGVKTGLSGQKCLLDEMEQEILDDCAGIAY